MGLSLRPDKFNQHLNAFHSTVLLCWLSVATLVEKLKVVIYTRDASIWIGASVNRCALRIVSINFTAIPLHL